MNDQLVRIGWCELFRTATGELVAVPSIPAHTASEYLHATVDGDVVVVTVKKREPCRTDEEAPEIPIGESVGGRKTPQTGEDTRGTSCIRRKERARGFALPVLQREVRLRTPRLRIRNGASAVSIR